MPSSLVSDPSLQTLSDLLEHLGGLPLIGYAFTLSQELPQSKIFSIFRHVKGSTVSCCPKNKFSKENRSYLRSRYHCTNSLLNSIGRGTNPDHADYASTSCYGCTDRLTP